MNHLSSTLVLCDLDHLLLGADGNLTQVVRDVLQLFVRRGGRFTVFSQRTPRAVRSILGSVRLNAPALVSAWVCCLFICLLGFSQDLQRR